MLRQEFANPNGHIGNTCTFSLAASIFFRNSLCSLAFSAPYSPAPEAAFEFRPVPFWPARILALV